LRIPFGFAGMTAQQHVNLPDTCAAPAIAAALCAAGRWSEPPSIFLYCSAYDLSLEDNCARYCLLTCDSTDERIDYIVFRLVGQMSDKVEYKVKITGPGHTFDRNVNEATANSIINLVMTGAPPAGTAPSGAGHKATTPIGDTPKQFLALKKPKTQYERVACLAYYLTYNRQTPQFKTANISKLNTEAAQTRLSNPAVAVMHATNTYQYLTAAGGGKKQITTVGEALVDALPDRAKVAQAMAEERPKKKRAARKKSK
jgi:hypothetical protein